MRFLRCGRKYCKLIMYTREISLIPFKNFKISLKRLHFCRDIREGRFRESGKSERR